MRKSMFATGIVCLAVLASVRPTDAAGEASVYFGRSYVSQFLLGDMATYGGTVGAFAGPIGFELGLEYSPIVSFQVGPVGLGASLFNVMGNLVLQVPAGRVAPYGTVGYGALIGRASFDPLPAEFLGTVGAFNYGFGAKVFITDHVGVRVDYRRFSAQTEDDSPDLQVPFTDFRIDSTPDLNRIVAGVAFRF